MKQRVFFIDIARALSIIGVMVIHTYSYHLSSPLSFAMWNYLQFVVITFVFLSGYVLKPLDSFSLAQLSVWLKKRFVRLYVPFLVYFLIHFSLFLLFPWIFRNLGMQKSVWYFLSTITLVGGLNTTWLPLLFLQLTFLTPVLFFCMKRKALWIYIAGASLFTLWISFFYRFPYAEYRLVMWIPWSLIYLLGYFFSQKKRIGIYAATFFISCSLFVISYVSLVGRHSLLFYDNKYPPTLYYLTFGIIGTIVTLLVSYTLEKSAAIKKISFWISTVSYQLFFFHFIVLDVVELLKIKNTSFEASIVVGGSILIYYILELVSRKTIAHLQRATEKTTVRSV